MKHLIKKQELLLRIAPGLEPFAMQHAASGYYREKLLSVLERVFDELSTEEEIIIINRLVIDIGRIDPVNRREDVPGDKLHAIIKKALVRVLAGERPASGLRRADVRENALDQWWYYMEKGRLPWSILTTNRVWHQRVLEMLSVDYGSVTRLREALHRQPDFLRRTSHQHSDEFLETLTGILAGGRQARLARRIESLCLLCRWMEKQFDDRTALLGGRMGSAEKRAEIIRALRRWIELHASFLALSGPERKAALWRKALLETAERPAEVRAKGVEGVLLQTFIYPVDAVVYRLLKESGPDLPEERIWDMDPATEVAGPAACGEELSDRAGEPGGDGRSVAVDRLAAVNGSAGVDEPAGVRGSADIGETKEVAARAGKEAGGRAAKEPVKGSLKEEEDGIFGRHAGLILLHPFLATFFHRCALWNNGVFTGPAARQRAVFLLYFLATGEKNAPEYDLVLPKLLCGYGLEEPIPASMEIPDALWREGEELLRNVILQWEKLKTTSIGGLREGFLQRTGKLVRRNDRMELMLEISSIDVLLDYLPWGLSIVKLPWLKEIITVEWR